MRYIIAMIFAIAGAALVMRFAAGPFASWATLQMSFESPDQNNDWHNAAFMAANLGGLILGWIIGWVVTSPLRRGGQRPS